MGGQQTKVRGAAGPRSNPQRGYPLGSNVFSEHHGKSIYDVICSHTLS